MSDNYSKIRDVDDGVKGFLIGLIYASDLITKHKLEPAVLTSIAVTFRHYEGTDQFKDMVKEWEDAYNKTKSKEFENSLK